MPEIKHYLVINTEPEIVFNAVTEEKGLAGWWTEDVIAKPEIGSVAEFKFGDKYHNKMRVANLEPNKKVEWECLDGDPEWIETKFVFDLEANDGKTILRFAQTDWREATDFYASCNYHWGFYMTSLKDYCEKG